MSRRLPLLLTAVTLVALAGPLFAFPGGPRPLGPPRGSHGAGGDEPPPLARLTSFLALSADQEDQAKAIFEAARERAEPLRDQGEPLHRQLRQAVEARDREAIADTVLAIDDLRSDLAAIRNQAADQLARILTAEQKQRFAWVREWHDERGPRGGGRRH